LQFVYRIYTQGAKRNPTSDGVNTESLSSL